MESFFILLSLGLIGVVAIFPYVLTIQGDLFRSIGQPIWLIFLAQLIQTTVLLAITIFFGLILSKQVELQLPLFEALTQRGNAKIVFKSIFGKSLIAGIVVAVVIYIVDILFSFLGAEISTHQSYAPIWQKLLASFYGGIVEEIVMRLFLMSLFIWIGMKLQGQKRPTNLEVIISILLAAVIFGLGHLPITASLTQLTPLIIVRAIILNGIGGVVFGWLFWKKGFESAVVAHFTTDIFLITLLPLIFG